MKQYELKTCFWCGKDIKAKLCKMSEALGETHEQQKYFSSDLPKERLPKGAKEIKIITPVAFKTTINVAQHKSSWYRFKMIIKWIFTGHCEI